MGRIRDCFTKWQKLWRPEERLNAGRSCCVGTAGGPSVAVILGDSAAVYCRVRNFILGWNGSWTEFCCGQVHTGGDFPYLLMGKGANPFLEDSFKSEHPQNWTFMFVLKNPKIGGSCVATYSVQITSLQCCLWDYCSWNWMSCWAFYCLFVCLSVLVSEYLFQFFISATAVFSLSANWI